MKIGTDIIEISRIRDAIQNGGKPFLDRVFTKSEQDYCDSRKNAKFQHYAGRFAAKEAIFKAVSEDIEISSWLDIEIICMESGKPQIKICEESHSIDVSISHCKEYATAVALYNEN